MRNHQISEYQQQQVTQQNHYLDKQRNIHLQGPYSDRLQQPFFIDSSKNSTHTQNPNSSKGFDLQFSKLPIYAPTQEYQNRNNSSLGIDQSFVNLTNQKYNNTGTNQFTLPLDKCSTNYQLGTQSSTKNPTVPGISSKNMHNFSTYANITPSTQVDNNNNDLKWLQNKQSPTYNEYAYPLPLKDYNSTNNVYSNFVVKQQRFISDHQPQHQQHNQTSYSDSQQQMQHYQQPYHQQQQQLENKNKHNQRQQQFQQQEPFSRQYHNSVNSRDHAHQQKSLQLHNISTLNDKVYQKSHQQSMKLPQSQMKEYQSNSTLPSNTLRYQYTPPSQVTAQNPILKKSFQDNSNQNNKTTKVFNFNNDEFINQAEGTTTANVNQYQATIKSRNSRDVSVTQNVNNNNTCTSTKEFESDAFINDFQSINKTILLIQTLCQTYQKDKVFAQSISKLVLELRDEISMQGQRQKKYSLDEQKLQTHNTHNLIQKIDALDQKRKFYKQMAKSMKIDIKNLRIINQSYSQQIREKDQNIDRVQVRINELEHEINEICKSQNVETNRALILQSFQRQQSFDVNNMMFKDLVNECNKYISENSSNSNDQNVSQYVDQSLLRNTISLIHQNQLSLKVYKKYFSVNESFNITNFNQILFMIQELVHELVDLFNGSPTSQKLQTPKSNSNRITLRKCSNIPEVEEPENSNQVTMQSIKEMKEKLLKEITDQLDAKVQSRIKFTMDQSSNLSEQNTLSKSQYISQLTRDKIQKEILAIMKEQHIIKDEQPESTNVSPSRNLETVKKQNVNKSSVISSTTKGSFVRQCLTSNHSHGQYSQTQKIVTNCSSQKSIKNAPGNSTNQQNTGKNSIILQDSEIASNLASPNKKQSANSSASRPTIRPKGFKQSSSNKCLINKGTDTNLDKAPEVSIQLQRDQKRKNSFIMGCDGDAALIYRQMPSDEEFIRAQDIKTKPNTSKNFDTPKKEELNIKLSIAEKQLAKKTTVDSKSQTRQSQTIGRNSQIPSQNNYLDIAQKQQPYQMQNRQSDVMFNTEEDEMLLSDIDLQKGSNLLQSVKTASFNNTDFLSGAEGGRSSRFRNQYQQNLQYQDSIKTDQLENSSMQLQSYLDQHHDSQLVSSGQFTHQNVTPQNQKSQGYNRFGFKSRQQASSSSKNNRI